VRDSSSSTAVADTLSSCQQAFNVETLPFDGSVWYPKFNWRIVILSWHVLLRIPMIRYMLCDCKWTRARQERATKRLRSRLPSPLWVFWNKRRSVRLPAWTMTLVLWQHFCGSPKAIVPTLCWLLRAIKWTCKSKSFLVFPIRLAPWPSPWIWTRLTIQLLLEQLQRHWRRLRGVATRLSPTFLLFGTASKALEVAW